MHAQLGFCQGNSGDPIFTETFGTGLQDSSLPAGTTTYNYANNQNPDDGFYTVSSTSNYFDWFNINDHTPNDTNGRMLIVNSSFAAGEFYKTTIDGLCENTTYEFSSWLINITPPNGFCGTGAIPINVSFEIWDNTDTTLLASGTTGNIFGTTATDWNQYALVFQSTVGQTSVILKMINNAPGGCGNDLAIDDIVFKSCGDSIDINDGSSNNSVTLCSTQAPFSDTITAMPDNVVFNNHFYQWQTSADGITWVDITGETNASISVTGITETTYYKAKVAEYAANLNNSDCITFSDVYEIIVNQAPAAPIIECWETATFNELSCSWTVTGTQLNEPTDLECWESTFFNNTTCAWEVNGTQPVQPTLECWETTIFNDTTCSWDISGTQPAQPNIECWESATFNTVTCTWDVSGAQPAQPIIECWETTIFNDTSCLWEVSGTQPVQPNIECWESATFNVATCTWDVLGTQPAQPIIECWETTIFNDTSCLWEVSGTQPAQPNIECWESATFDIATCTWDISGTQPTAPTLECWELANFNDATCAWEVTGAQPVQPTLECWETTIFNANTCSWDVTGTQQIDFIDEFISFCEGNDITIQADSNLVNPTFRWNSGEVTEFKTVNVAGIYVVVITDGCFTVEKTFYVEQTPNPIIENIVSDGSTIIINLSNFGDFEYSLDGISFQFNPVFHSVDNGSYTIYVKSSDCDPIVAVEYFHFFIQKFITPNGDGDNDFFALNVSQYFTTSEVYIFNRYGELLYSAINRNVYWDGTFNNKDLPTSDYWYRIILDGKEFVGHFSLKR